ncbi:MAG TPA: hypothetical protein V6C58_02285 [Allocoleopsis sp.]
MNIKDFPELTNPQLNDWLLIQQNATIPAYHKIKLQTLLEFLGGAVVINPPVNNSIVWVDLSESQWLNLTDSQWLLF